MNDIRDGHYTLGKAYLSNGQYTEAITHFQMVLRLDADFIDAHCGLCRAYLAQNALEKAETSALTARRLAPNSTEALSLCDTLRDAHYHNGITCYNEERYREAVGCFQKTITLDATYIAAHHALALAYFGLHELAEAKKAAQEALQIDPNYPPVLSFLETIDPRPSVPEPLKTLPAQSEESQEETQPVMPVVQPVNASEVAVSPASDKEMQQALVFLNNKQYPQAEAALKKVIKANPHDAEPHYHLAQTYVEIGALNDAEREAGIALRIRPEYQPALQLQNAITLLKKREKNQQLHKKIRRILLPLTILAVAGFIAFRLGVFSGLLPEKIPPKLSIDTTLEDPKNNNGYIDAGEDVRLKLTITNSGSSAENLKIRILPKSIGGLRYQAPETTFSIRKNGFQTLRIPMTADQHVLTRKIVVKIQVLEKHQILATRDTQLHIKEK